MNTRKIYWVISIVLLWFSCAFLFNYFYQAQKNDKIQEVLSEQKIQITLASKNFNQLFSKWNNVLYYLSRDSNVIYLNNSGKDDLQNLSDFLRNEVKGITRCDTKGKIVFTIPDSKATGADISQQQHMAKILSDHMPVVSDVFTTVQGYSAIAIHYPIFKHGNFYGTIALVLDFQKISSDILSDIKIGHSGLVWLLSRSGMELFCENPQHIAKGIDKSHQALASVSKSMLLGKTGVDYYKSEGKNHSKYMVYYQPVKVNNTFWSLASVASVDEATVSLHNFRNSLLIIFGIIFFTGIIISFYTIKAWVTFKESELRLRAERSLQESEEKYRIVIETTDTGYAVIDLDGHIKDANKMFAIMAGYPSVEDILGKSFDKWTTSKDIERFRNCMDKCKKDQTVHNLEIEFQHPSGALVPVEINASKVTSKDEVIMICRNISDRKQAREELMKERSLLRTLLDNLPSGVFIKDMHFRKIIANTLHIKSVLGHLKRTGRNDKIDILGKTDFEVFSEEEALNFEIDDKKVIKEGVANLNKVEPGWGPDGEKIWLLISKVPIKAEDNSIIGMVGITTGITDQKNIEEQLRLAKEKAEQSDKLKTAFLNNISHEIRTPLNAIIGFSGLLKDPDLTTDRKVHFLNIIEQSSNQLLMIITDIINIATIEAGQLKMNPGRMELNSVLSILFNQYQSVAEFKNLALMFSAPLSDKEATIETDATKFLEILSNLINNAIKFTITGSINYGYYLEDNQLIFFVKDTGIGISEEYHASIFERFWQVDSSSSHRFGGTGLGLSISKTYVELLGGKIWLTSTPDVGTTFFFSLPYKNIS